MPLELEQLLLAPPAGEEDRWRLALEQ